MIGALKWLTKRPSDLQIRLGNSIFGLFLTLGVLYNFFYLQNALESNFFWIEVGSNILWIKILTLGVGLIPLAMGVGNFCFMKSKYVRIMQIIIGIFLFYISSKIPESPSFDFGTILFILGFIPLFAGITGKAITKSCLRYGEKVQKIRV